MYRFNLERNADSRHAVQAAGPTGPREHTYLALGSFYLYGRSVQRLVGLASGMPAVLTAREPFYRAGGDFSFNYRNFNLFGLFMHGRDQNLLPVDATGNVVTLPISGVTTATGFIRGAPATFSGGFLQADYLLYPWMMLIMRYDVVNSRADFVNGLAGLTGTSFFGPAHTSRNRFTPGVQFLIHANIKTSFEYQIRPPQQIAAGVDPLTGAPVMTLKSFRVNTAVAGLEFVY